MPSPLLPLRRTAVALLAVGVFASAALAQPPGFRPPNPGGSFNPPNMPNPPGFNPANPPGFNPTNPPIFNPPTVPSGPVIETVWYCEGCGHELGRGPAPPVLTRCPYCGVRLTGIDFGGMHNGPLNPGPGFTPPPGGSMQPGAPMPAAPPAPATPVNNPPPADGGPNPAALPAGTAPASTGTGYTPSSSSPTGPGIGTIVLGVVVIVAGLVILGGAACLIIYNVARSNTPTRRRRYRIDMDD